MSWGGAIASSFWKVCGFTVHMKTGGLRFWISPPWDLFSKKCVFSHCVCGIRMDGQPIRCNMCAFKKNKTLSFGWGLKQWTTRWFLVQRDDKQPFLTHGAAPETKMVLNLTICFFLAITTLTWLTEGLMFPPHSASKHVKWVMAS